MVNQSRRGASAARISGVVALALCAGQAAAQVDASWAGPVTGDWSDGRLWTGGAVPRVSGDRATIDATGMSYEVSLDISVSLAGFTMGGGFATLRGIGGSTMEVVDTVFADASLIGLGGYTSTGRLTFAGDVCDDLTDLPLEHTGSIAEWIGAGDILLGDNAEFTNGNGVTMSTFNIENASTLFGTGSLINNGKISKNSSGTTTFTGVSFTNNGDVCVLDGELQLINVGLTQLTTGYWEVAGDADLNVVGQQYDSIGATVVLDGPESRFGAIDGISAIDSGGSLLVRNGRDFTTRGNLTVSGSLTVGQPQLAPSSFTVSGNLGNNGSVHLSNGSLTVAGAHVIGPGGTLSGNGAHIGSLTNNGLISPGVAELESSSPGQLIARGGVFEQGEQGRLLIEIGGLQPGSDHDVFIAEIALFDPTGDLLAGVLEIELIDGFVPPVGSTFDVLQYTERAGEFAEYVGLTQHGITFVPRYTEGALRLHVIPAPGPAALACLALGAVGARRRRRS